MTDKASPIWRLHFGLVLLVSCWPNLGSDTSSNAKLREMFPDTYHKKVSTLEFNIPYYHKFEAMSLSFFMARVVRKGVAHKFQSRKCAKRTSKFFARRIIMRTLMTHSGFGSWSQSVFNSWLVVGFLQARSAVEMWWETA